MRITADASAGSLSYRSQRKRGRSFPSLAKAHPDRTPPGASAQSGDMCGKLRSSKLLTARLLKIEQPFSSRLSIRCSPSFENEPSEEA